MFNVNFFYLKKFRDKDFTFSYINEPFFKGNVLFGLDFKNRMRPLSFDKIEKDGVVSPINPHLFKKFQLSESNKFVGLPSQSSTKDLTPIYDILSNFQYDENKIINVILCSSCLDSQKFTILNEKSRIISFKSRNNLYKKRRK